MGRSSLWNFYARAYDVINKNVPYLHMLDDVASMASLKSEQRVLDAGCGTGNLLRKLSTEHPDDTFVGVDASEEMLNRARKKFVADSRVSFQRVDLDARLPFPDASFDAVVSVNTLYALREPQRALAEFRRVLKPRGTLVYANPHDRSTFSGIMKGQLRALGFFPFLAKFIANFPALLIIMYVNVVYLRRNTNYWSEGKTRHILEEQGFADTAVGLTYADQALLVSATKH